MAIALGCCSASGGDRTRAKHYADLIAEILSEAEGDSDEHVDDHVQAGGPRT